MHLGSIKYWGKDDEVHRIAQSDSVSEAAKIFTRNLMCLMQ